MPIPVLSIPTIQGAGHVSAFAGQEVQTGGIVTAVDYDGYYVQDAAGDGDWATSDAIFVFTGSGSASPVAVGDEIAIVGFVSEYIPGGAGSGNLSTTQIATPDAEVLSSGNALPDAVEIGGGGRTPPTERVISDDETPVNLQTDPGLFDPENDGIDFWESLEAMLVSLVDSVAISATNVYDETWVVVDEGAQVTGGSGGLNERGGLDINADSDGYGDLNPERIQIQYDSFFDLLPDGFVPPDVELGDRLSDVTGVVGYDFGNFQVMVTEAFEIEAESANSREVTALAGDNGNKLTVASYNILNVTANPADGDAEQIAALARQIVDNLGSPDIIGLEEVQDDSGVTDDGTLSADQTLQAIVDAIAAAGGPTYSFVSALVDEDGETGGVPGGNIRNALLYNAERVALKEAVTLEEDVLSDLGVSNPAAFDGTRDPLLGVFAFNGQEVSVIVNHLSSRSGSDPIFGGPQPFFQAGEDEREAAAKTLNEVVDALGGGQADAKIVVLGDMNTFEFTDELSEDLTGLGAERVLTNLLQELEGDEAYTYVFDGNAQVLDHIFVTDGLLAKAEFDIVHVNTDFADFASDHDPILASLRIDSPAQTLLGSDEDDELVGSAVDDLIIGRRGDDLLVGLEGDDVARGGRGDDRLDGGWGDDLLEGAGGSDLLAGGNGDDVLDGGNEDDFLFGGRNDDELYGGDGTDFLFGGGRQDRLEGGEGDDGLSGGENRDWLEGGNGDDALEGGRGLDWLFGGNGDDDIAGGAQDDRAEGGRGEDDLEGGAGDDSLSGGDDDDWLDGEEGRDWLSGGGGDDLLTGGEGRDRFVFDGDFGDDRVTDFETDLDRIVVAGAEAGEVSGAAEAAGFLLTVAGAASEGTILLEGVASFDLDDLVFA